MIPINKTVIDVLEKAAWMVNRKFPRKAVRCLNSALPHGLDNQ